jgi:hypothetical protein
MSDESSIDKVLTKIKKDCNRLIYMTLATNILMFILLIKVFCE